MMNNIDNISILGLVLTIVALFLAIWQAVAAKKQTTNLSSISNSMSTKYLNSFPGYISFIADLLSRAEHQVLILTPLSMHGVYSASESWLNAKYALEAAQEKHHNLEIKCIFSDTANQRILLTNQFKESIDNWEDWKSKQSQKIKPFHRRFGNNNFSELSFEGFIDLFEVAASRELETTYKNAVTLEVPHRPPLNMWIIDGKEAIFAMSCTTPDYFVESFWTSDNRLIDALINMHTEYFNQNEMNTI